MKPETIEWHEGCAARIALNLQHKRARIEKEQIELIESEANLRDYRYKISEAKRLGKTKFNAEKFRVKRAKKEVGK